MAEIFDNCGVLGWAVDGVSLLKEFFLASEPGPDADPLEKRCNSSETFSPKLEDVLLLVVSPAFCGVNTGIEEFNITVVA